MSMELNQSTPERSHEASRETPNAREASRQGSDLETRPAKSDPYNVYIAIYSLLSTSVQLIELYDRQPGNRKRFDMLSELIKDIHPFTSFQSK